MRYVSSVSSGTSDVNIWGPMLTRDLDGSHNSRPPNHGVRDYVNNPPPVCSERLCAPTYACEHTRIILGENASERALCAHARARTRTGNRLTW